MSQKCKKEQISGGKKNTKAITYSPYTQRVSVCGMLWYIGNPMDYRHAKNLDSVKDYYQIKYETDKQIRQVWDQQVFGRITSSVRKRIDVGTIKNIDYNKVSIIKGCKKVYHSALRGLYQDANSL